MEDGLVQIVEELLCLLCVFFSFLLFCNFLRPL